MTIVPTASTGSASWKILDLLRAEERLSRVELASRAAVTQATVTQVVKGLLEAGVVREDAREVISRGAPRRLLKLVADARYSIGVQFDRTATTVLLVDYAGRQVASTSTRGIGTVGPHAAIEVLVDQVRELLRCSGIPIERVLGVGLATFGPQDRDKGMLLTPQPTPEWHGFPLAKVLSDALHLPVLLEHDATAAAIGELAMGTVPTRTFGLLYMATGIGGAVVVDGVPYRGRSSNAVEVDHVLAVPGGRPCLCGARGCVGAEAMPLTVSAIAAERPELSARLGITGAMDEGLADFERIARAALGGNQEAMELLERSADLLGIAAVTMCNLFDLDTLVLAGPAVGTVGPLYRERIEAIVRSRAANRELSEPTVFLSTSVEEASAMGAALHVLRSVRPRAATMAPARPVEAARVG